MGSIAGAVSYPILEHPAIGTIKGISRTAGVNQFLGLRYASLQDRFATARLLKSSSNGGVGFLDATALGPVPLNNHNACEVEQSLIQHALPSSPLRQSDTECLTLNIATPSHQLPDLLPVVVFIHGGGFWTGSSSYPHYDLGGIGKLSIEVDKPIIAVSINYRLGAAGFLYSSAMGDAGYKMNRGIHDQQVAFRWIKTNISGFGGDPERVTCLGQSAGGASARIHLHSTEPFFQQLISLGAPLVQNVRSPEQAEIGYEQAVTAIGAQHLPPNEQVQRLLQLPIDDFVKKIVRKMPITPLVDGDIIKGSTTFKVLHDDNEMLKLFPAVRHCNRVLFADCEMDGSIILNRLQGRTDILPKTLETCLSTVFDPINPDITPAIAEAYALNSAVTSNTMESTLPVLNFANDIFIHLGTVAFTKAWSAVPVPGTEAYLAYFNCPNPWDGTWKGRTPHILDVAFVLQNFNEYLSLGQRRCAERYATDIITFAYGAQPWPAYRKIESPGAMVYYAHQEGSEDESRFVTDASSQLTRRRDSIVKIVGEANLDKVMTAFEMFLRGPK